MKKLALLLIFTFIFQIAATSQPCLPQGITFTTQAEIDDFQTNYPNCIEIEGYVIITGEAITNLNGLDVLTSIGEDLWIFKVNNLTSLAGLDNVTAIGGAFGIISNDKLTDMTGLANLTSIDEYFWVFDNSHLNDFAGLQNLTSIGGDLEITDNNHLRVLEGLNNIEAETIENLIIYNNPLLYYCDIESICEYLLSPNGTVNIHNNANGCVNEDQVLAACELPCPVNVTFFSQAEIDNFPIYYPTCTSITGNVKIAGDDITNLNGLTGLTSFGGNLSFRYNDSLANLTGLENVTSIGGTLNIESNDTLTSLTGLEALTSIGEHLFIYNNNALTSLSGLDALTSIGGSLNIEGNDTLISLTELEALTFIGEHLFIYNNNALISLAGLDNLDSIGGDLEILYNNALSSLTGLESLDASSIGDLNIYGNTSLTFCEIQSLCEYLSSPGGSVNIYNNATGCNNPAEVASACGITLPCLPYGNYHFHTQSDIDNFQTNYPNCTDIEGDIELQGDFTNLNGLNVFTSIGKSLTLKYNSELTSLSGLENLTSIGGNLEVSSNAALTSLTGLQGLDSIGGFLSISYNDNLTSLAGLDKLRSIGGYMDIAYSDGLVDFSGLENLTSIGDFLWIYMDDSLTNFQGLNNLDSIGGDFNIQASQSIENLSGLENLSYIGGSLFIYGISPHQPGNISLVSLNGLDNLSTIGGDLSIIGNDSLSMCDVNSICNYLANPNGNIEIKWNASGCKSQEEVEEACAITSIEEALQSEKLLVYPNPFPTSTTIAYELQQPATVQITLFNHLGKQIELIQQNQSAGKLQIIWNAEGLPAGIYFCALKTKSGTQTVKMIKMK